MTSEAAIPSSSSARLPWLVFGIGVSCALHVGKLPVAIPALQAALGLTLIEAGFLLSIVQLAGMTIGLLVGLAADRLGPRRVMQIGLLLLALGSAWGATSETVTGLLVSRALEGFGFLLAVLPAPGLLRQRVAHGPSLSRALGWWGAYMPLGTAIALLLGAALIGAAGWRVAWALLAVVSVLAWCILTFTVASDAALGLRSSGLPLWPRLRRTLSAPGPWWVAIAFFLYSGQWLAVVGFLPTIYAQAGFGGAWIGALTALAAAINMIGNVAAGHFLSRGVLPRKLLTMAYVCMAFGAMLAFAGQMPPVMQYLAVLLFSCVGGLIPGTLFVVSVQLAPDQDTVSTTVGWMQQLSALGQFVGPPAVAWLATRVGNWSWTWAVTGACCLMGCWVASRVQREWLTLRP